MQMRQESDRLALDPQRGEAHKRGRDAADSVQSNKRPAAGGVETAPPGDEASSPEAETAPPGDKGSSPEAETAPPGDEGSRAEAETAPPGDEGSRAEAETAPPGEEGTRAEAETAPPDDEGTRAEAETAPPGDERSRAECRSTLLKTTKREWTEFLDMCESESTDLADAAYEKARLALGLNIHQMGTGGKTALDAACSGNGRAMCEWLSMKWPRPNSIADSREEWMSWVQSACLGRKRDALVWLVELVTREDELAECVDTWLREGSEAALQLGYAMASFACAACLIDVINFIIERCPGLLSRQNAFV
jgi:hypothetical protein